MKNERRFYVYEHWRPDKGVCFYVGKGSGTRAYNMSSREPHHKAIRKKLMAMGLSVEIRIFASNLTEVEAFEVERERIAHFRSKGSCLSNITDGGGGTSGHRHTDETKEKMRISQGKRGPRAALSQEAKDKISKSNRGNKKRLGKTHTDEVKSALRSKAIENQEIFKKYQLMGPAALSKKVTCLDDGSIHDSASAAARRYSVSRSALIELCLGKNGRKTVGGLRFQYIGEN
jgi:hypothetical protein